jgi:hypothetical protein
MQPTAQAVGRKAAEGEDSRFLPASKESITQDNAIARPAGSASRLGRSYRRDRTRRNNRLTVVTSIFGLPIPVSHQYLPATTRPDLSRHHFEDGQLGKNVLEHQKITHSIVIYLFEPAQGFIDSYQVHVGRFREKRGFIEGDLHSASSALRPAVALRVVEQDSAHHFGGDSEEVTPVYPIRVLAEKPQIRLVNQHRSLQRVSRALSAHVASGQAAKFVVDQRHRRIKGGLIAVTRGEQELGQSLRSS